MLYSLKQNMSCFSRCDLKIFYSSSIAPLAEHNRELIRCLYPHVQFENICQEKYQYNLIEYEPHRPAYLTLEVFKEASYNKVFFMDADTLCVADISHLFLSSQLIQATRCRRVDTDINTGVMMLDRKLLEMNLYNEMISKIPLVTEYMLDQPIINMILKLKSIEAHLLDDFHNYLHLAGHPNYPSDHRFISDFKHIKILHWGGREQKRKKPWKQIGITRYPSQLLWEFYNSMMLYEVHTKELDK